jgi:hypothetical protein
MNDLLNIIPEKYRGWLLFAVAVSPYLTRACHALMTGGGLRGIFAAIWLGTNTPQEQPKPTSVAASVLRSGQGGFVRLSVLLWVVAMLPILFIEPGCHSTPQQAVYRTTGATVVSVDAAMDGWGAYVRAVHPPLVQEQAVKAAYERYQKAFAVVCDAGAIYAGSGQTNAPAVAGALQTAIVNANTSISDLENLITSFGVKL